MSTAAELVAAAQHFIGVTESPANSNMNPFAGPAGHVNGRKWCATFVVAMARSVGLRLPSESPGTILMFAGFVKAGAGFYGSKGLRPGDIVFFNFPGGDPIEHVGICESVSATGVVCIEGNTSSGSAGSQSNGGGVYRRARSLSLVAGYGRPAYKETTMPENPAPTYTASARLQAFQAIVNPETGKLGYYMVTEDGEVFGFGVPFLGRIDTAAV